MANHNQFYILKREKITPFIIKRIIIFKKSYLKLKVIERIKKIMAILTQVPVGSKLKVKETQEVVSLVKIYNYPTKFEVINDLGEINYYRTHQVELLESTDEQN